MKKYNKEELKKIASDNNLLINSKDTMFDICTNIKKNTSLNINCEPYKTNKKSDNNQLFDKYPINKKIIEEFEKLVEQKKYESETSKDPKIKKMNRYKIINFRKLIAFMKIYDKEIESSEELNGIPKIGTKIKKRVDEIIKTGKLEEVTIEKGELEKLKSIEELKEVYGIGEILAKRYVDMGYNTIKKLKDAYDKNLIDLPEDVVQGLEYHDLFKTNIPREEVEMIGEYISEKAKSINENLNIIVCGSYRRNYPRIDDIDILLYDTDIKTKNDLDENPNYLEILVDELINSYFIIKNINDYFTTNYYGFCQLNETYPVRRLDIIYIPFESLYAATLHFTGPKSYNIEIRNIAKKKGYTLNQYGLFKQNETNPIPIKSEMDIFKILGIEYTEPENRLKY